MVAVVWIHDVYIPPLPIRRVLRDVDRGPAVLAAQGEALEHSQGHQDDRREDADLRVAGQEADEHRRAAHDRNRQQEGDLAAGLVTDTPEHDRAERPNGEPGAERGEGAEHRCRRVAREEDRRQERGEHGVQVEVVPLDHRADR